MRVFNGGLHLRVFALAKRQITKKTSVSNPVNRSFLNKYNAVFSFKKNIPRIFGECFFVFGLSGCV